MSDDLVNIEVNGTPMQARKGQMIIEVTDANAVYVPRFCYHEKLSIAANCRMCLVEVEKAPKPLPACATPVTEGMKIFTKSPRAISAQKATMEFLLINHPLDCPICDQAGECELQDLSVGYGRDVSRYSERKRVVKDKNLGPLISTDMTRCIHCTRCVRFGQEITGVQEMGTVGRGDRTEIGTFIERSIDHELSANIIDLCPVGALNNKPYRYTARAWEMTQHASVAPHDCIGSNIYFHVYNGRVKRAVPRINEEINETWISDRDRFSCEAIQHADRLLRPRVKDDGIWRDCEWAEALERTAASLTSLVEEEGAQGLGILASPSITLEEALLLNELADDLGCANIDYRLRTRDFRDQDSDPIYPCLGLPLAEVDNRDAILVVGSNLRSEAPILAHRVRKAAMQGAAVSFVNASRYEYLFPVAGYLDSESGVLAENLAGLVAAAAELTSSAVPEAAKHCLPKGTLSERHLAMARSLVEAKSGAIVVGLIAQRDTSYADIRSLAGAVAELTGCTLGFLSEGANSAGASLAGVLPHRGRNGEPRGASGLNAVEMLLQPRKAYLLVGVEPERDLADSDAALKALGQAETVVGLVSFVSPSLLECCDVLLPVAAMAETSGTFVNIEGRWQSFSGAARPMGESRPAWKVLRVLGNLLDLQGYQYETSDQVRDSLATGPVDLGGAAGYRGSHVARLQEAPSATIDVPMYSIDALVRRSAPLQQTREAEREFAAPLHNAAAL